MRVGGGLKERTFARVVIPDDDLDCWTWDGAHASPSGYAQIWDGQRVDYAHRVVYILLGGTIPDGLHIDHLCRNVGCVNPQHLEPVTHRENALRGEMNRPFVCKNGHVRTVENTYIRRDKGTRMCLDCQREYQRTVTNPRMKAERAARRRQRREIEVDL